MLKCNWSQVEKKQYFRLEYFKMLVLRGVLMKKIEKYFKGSSAIVTNISLLFYFDL